MSGRIPDETASDQRDWATSLLRIEAVIASRIPKGTTPNLNEDTWHIMKNTPKLSGFLGTKGKPIPISNDEAKRISQQVIDGVEKSRPAVMYDVGEQVKVIDGPFASFNGEIEQIDEEKARLRVAVSIFGRSTPVDLEYSQVEKA